MRRLSESGRNLHSGRLWEEWPGRLAVLHKTQDLNWLRRYVGDGRAEYEGVPVRSTRVSSMERSSSSKEDKACEISGFKDTKVLFPSSEPYFCFTSKGKPGFIICSHKSTIVFSMVGDKSSSRVMASPWCVMCCQTLSYSPQKKP